MLADYALTWEPGLTLAMIKCEAIRQALEHYAGDKTQAARALGMGLRTLRIWVAERPELEAYRVAGHRTQLPRVEAPKWSLDGGKEDALRRNAEAPSVDEMFREAHAVSPDELFREDSMVSRIRQHLEAAK